MIATKMPGRTGKQCRERWHNHLDPSIAKERWTEEENEIVIDAHRVRGNQARPPPASPRPPQPAPAEPPPPHARSGPRLRACSPAAPTTQ